MKKIFSIMRFVLIVIVLLIALAVLGVYIFLKNFDVNHHKPQIISAASSALGRQVDMGPIELNFSWQEGLRLKLRDVTIAEDPNVEGGTFLRVQEVSVGADIFSYIMTRQISLSTVLLKNPEIRIIRAKNGSWNVETIGKTSKADAIGAVPPVGGTAQQDITAEPQVQAPVAATVASTPPAPLNLPLIFIDDVTIDNASITFLDRAGANELAYELDQVGLKMNNFSLQNSFSFLFMAAVLSDGRNVKIEGTARLDPKTSEIALNQTNVTVDLMPETWDRLRFLISSFAPVPLPESVSGNVTVAIKALIANSTGLKTLKTDLGWTNGKLKFSDPASGINIEASSITLNATDFSLAGQPFTFNLSAGLFSDQPNISLSGKATLDLASQNLVLQDTTFSTDLALLPLEKIKASIKPLAAMPVPDSVAGKFSVLVKELSAGPAGLGDFTAYIDLKEGALVIKDVTPGVSIEASKIELSIKDFALGGPFAFSLGAALFGDMPNIAVLGMAQFDPLTQDLQLKDTKVSVDLAALNIPKIKSSVAALQSLPLPETLSGKLELAVRELSMGAEGLENFRIDSQLTDGIVVVKEISPGTSLNASKISWDIKNLSSTDPFSFKINAALYGDEPNVDLAGSGQLDLATQSLKLADTTFETDLSKISLTQLQSAVASLKDVALPTELAGKLKVTMTDVQINSSGLPALILKGELADGRAKLPQLAIPVTGIHSSFAVAESNLTVDDLSFLLGEGKVKATGNVTDIFAAQNFQADLDIQGVNLAQVIDQAQQPVKIQGNLIGTYQIQGSGFDPQKLIPSLNGSGRLEIQNGLLKDINLLKQVLEKLSMFPNFEERINATLPEKYKEVLNQKDTLLKKVQLDSVVQNGALVINPLDVEAEGFKLSGEGQIALADMDTNLKTSFFIVEDLAAVMAQAVGELQYLMNDARQIQFPVNISGKIPNVSAFPDIEYITRQAIKNKGLEEIQKVLQKAVGGEEGAEPSQEQKAIEGILDSIFK